MVLVIQWVHSPTRCPAEKVPPFSLPVLNSPAPFSPPVAQHLVFFSSLPHFLYMCVLSFYFPLPVSLPLLLFPCLWEKCCQYLLLHRCVCLSVRLFLPHPCRLFRPLAPHLTIRLLNDSTISANEIFLQRI